MRSTLIRSLVLMLLLTACGGDEDPDVAGGGQGPLDAPQEVVLQLDGGRLLEGGDLHTLRVDQSDSMAQGAALARGVHALEHQQDAAVAARTALGEEPLLEVGQLVPHPEESLLAVRLVPVVAGRRIGGQRGQVDRAGREAQRHEWEAPLRAADP